MTRSFNLLECNFPGRQMIRSLFNSARRSVRGHNSMRVMVFGDSNAYRPGNGNNCWPALLQRKSGNRLKVINESYDGRTTQYDTGQCNGLRVIAKKIVKANPIEFVLIALGTNDVKSKYGPPDAAEVVQGIDEIVKIMKKCNSSTKPILLTPPPLGNVASGDLAGGQDRIPPVVAEYRRYANTQNIPIIDLYSTIDINVDLEPDCIHLSHSGRKKIADILWDNLQGVCQYVEPVGQAYG